MALIGDKEMSDLEEMTESDEDATTKESNPDIDTIIDSKQPVVLEDSDHTPTPSFFEEIDDFEIDDDLIGDIGVVDTNSLIQSALEGFISVKKAR